MLSQLIRFHRLLSRSGLRTARKETCASSRATSAACVKRCRTARFFNRHGGSRGGWPGQGNLICRRMQYAGGSPALANGGCVEGRHGRPRPVWAAGAMKLGLIAGNGRFPFLLLDAARAQGLAVAVAAIREETDAEIDERARKDHKISVHWLSLGELSKLIELFHKEGVTKAVMAGQGKHKQIFSSIRPDWRRGTLIL